MYIFKRIRSYYITSLPRGTFSLIRRFELKPLLVRHCDLVNYITKHLSSSLTCRHLTATRGGELIGTLRLKE